MLAQLKANKCPFNNWKETIGKGRDPLWAEGPGMPWRRQLQLSHQCWCLGELESPKTGPPPHYGPSTYLTAVVGFSPLFLPMHFGETAKALGTSVGKMVRESQEWRENLPSTQGSILSVDIPGGHQTLVQYRLYTSKKAHKIKPNQTTPKRQQQQQQQKYPTDFPRKFRMYKYTKFRSWNVQMDSFMKEEGVKRGKLLF